MANPVQLRSRDQILGQLVAKILNNTDLSDLQAGSSLASLLEAIAVSQSQIESTTLKILETNDIESLTSSDLDKKAEDMRLPNGIGGYGRKPSSQSSGTVKINAGYTKISSKFYAGKTAPYAGVTVVYLEDASSFPKDNLGVFLPGQVYIGRGTVDRFEGPIAFTSIVDNGSFYTMTLSSPVTKNHLQSDAVVLSQGGDRSIFAGTIVQVPANSDSPAIQYRTVEDLIIPDGEADGAVNVACVLFGESGNALKGAIKEFVSLPFTGASVTNETSFVNGKSSENDEDLRQRIKSYPSTLSRGTDAAILASLLGVQDPVSGRSVASAVIFPPVEPGDAARVFIDDNTGLEPTYDGIPYEMLLQSAIGQETKFRASQFPITSALIEGSNHSPYILNSSMTITVKVDEVTETYTLDPSNYENISAATAYEVIRDLNKQSNIVGFRTVDSGTRIVMMDLSGKAEVMEVQSGDLQAALGFPLATVRPIFLYKNSQLLSFRGKTATLETRPVSQWTINPGDLTNVRVKVDGVIQTITITDADFAVYSSTMSNASIDQWTEVFAKKIAGVKFTKSGQLIVWSTYQTFSSGGSLEILDTKSDGSPAPWISDSSVWKPLSSGGKLSDVGNEKDYNFNRFSGEINLVSKPSPGDQFELATAYTRAHVHSVKTDTGVYSLATIPATVGRARVVVGFDGEFSIRTTSIASGSSFTPTHPDPAGALHVIRLTANDAGVFRNAEVDDWLYLVEDSSMVTWGSEVEGLYRIKNAGKNLYASNEIFTNKTASVSAGSQIANTTLNSYIVKVTHANHNLKTGDLITVSTAVAIGGISGANLSVVNAPIIVLDDTHYQYTALAAATSSAQGTLTTVGNNRVVVAHTTHGFEDKAEVQTTSLVAIGGISSGNLSVTSEIEFIDVDSYAFRAASAATSTDSDVLTVTYLADCWIEIEVSNMQFPDWSSILSAPQSLSNLMVYLFRSTTIPQVIDFGSMVSTLSVDDVVSEINSQIATGTAEKISPKQLILRSNNFISGSCAVLAVVGSAGNVFETNVKDSIQAHTAASLSSTTQSGVPVIVDVVEPTAQSAGFPTRTYLKADREFVDVINNNDNPTIQSPSFVASYPEGFEHLWFTGKQSGLFGRVYNNQTSSPYSGIMRGDSAIGAVQTSDTDQSSPSSLDRYANYGMRMRDLPFTENDKLVVEMDLDAVNKTVAVNMSKTAKILDIDAISLSGKGQVISFRLKDPDDSDKNFFDSTSVYKDFDFTDFKILTKNVGLYREDISSDRGIVLRSVAFGAPSKLKLYLTYPTNPDVADLSVSHSSQYANPEAETNLYVTLASQAVLSGSPVTSGNYRVKATLSGTLYDWRFSHPLINSTGQYSPTKMLNVSGGSQIDGTYKVTAGHYYNVSNPAVTIAPGSDDVVVTIGAHSLLAGDLINVVASGSIAAIPAVDLTASFAPITAVGATTVTYKAASSSPLLTGTLDSVTRDAINLTNSSAATTNLLSTVVVTSPGHGLFNGETVTVTASSAIGGISPANLSGSFVITYIDASTFSYTAAAAATSTDVGIIGSITRASQNVLASSAVATQGSNSIEVAYNGISALYVGNTVTIVTANGFGGISSANLSVASAIVTYADGINFRYLALSSAAMYSGNLSSLVAGVVIVKAPGHGGVLTQTTFDSSVYPIRAWNLAPKTWTDIAAAINSYLPDNPIATAEAIGTNIPSNPVMDATYVEYPASTSYSGSDIIGALAHHAFTTKTSGSAGIWQYDSSNPLANNIKATVQSDDSIFPTTADALGTTYSPINEEVVIVPTNSNTVQRWLSFKASSSLNILANIERVNADGNIQISSRSSGADGAVNVTGVAANQIISSVIGNSSSSGDSTKSYILSADAKSLVRNSLVKVQNSISSEILRAYRTVPVGASITASNTVETGNYFRATNYIKYIRIDSTTGRILFLREGQAAGAKHLVASNTITLSSLGNGLVRVQSAQAGGAAGTGKLKARVGDMMYVQPSAGALPFDFLCKEFGSTDKHTDPDSPEYVGYPVVHVTDEYDIIIIAPNVTTFGTTILTTPSTTEDIVFIPAIWNEKNIRTNHKEGAKFDELVNNGEANYIVKALGNNLVSVILSNSSAESTDTMLLNELSVSTDDYAVFGSEFDPANQGTFKVVAHNGRNHLIVANPEGGKDEVVNRDGSRSWMAGTLNDGVSRSLRVISGDSIRIGDYLRISSGATGSQWFDDVFMGSWKIKGMGYSMFDFTGALPHSYSTGTIDMYEFCPFVDIDMTSAPLGIKDITNPSNFIDSFAISSNFLSIGFVEAEPFNVYRMVAGHVVDDQDPERSVIYLVPEINTQKVSSTFGTSIQAINKLGFEQKAFQGIDGYKYYTGLLQQSHRIVDGLPSNPTLYPGVKASGATIEVLSPLIKSVEISLQVKPKDGVSLNTISPLIKATVAAYINGLGVGKPVVISEIIRIVQGLSGVFSVAVSGTVPVADDDRIVVSEQEKAVVLSSDKDIVVG